MCFFCVSLRRMFFTVWGEVTKLETALLDGSQRVVMVNHIRIVRPCSLTLDYANEHVYWADAYLDRIERIDYNGSNRKLIISQQWVSYHQTLNHMYFVSDDK